MVFHWRSRQSDRVARYESKYIIPRKMVPALRKFIEPFCVADPYASGDPPEYVITTLQLDDEWYSLHHAKECEANRRFKLRVRTYGDIGSAPVFTEVKAKLERTIEKVRAAVPFARWSSELITGVDLPRLFKSEHAEIDFLQFKRLVWEIGARPIALVRYIRESHVGTLDLYARVTFDHHLQYQMTDSWTDFGRSGVWRGMDSSAAQGFGLPFSGVVLEVKTLANVPEWVLEMVERFELNRSGNCKYSTALWREGQFRGHPDTNAFTADQMAWM
ncbi:MAG: polyphosphate polymerase domain-containing protein [Kiritimatiellae bacterium]|nr:polyphosphate polymerase domain-containing protein [Kiritimatiellia bacterium]